MKKEIDQRSKNRLLIECNCGANHFVEFDFSTDIHKYEDKTEKTKKKIKTYEWKDYWISFIDENNRFWSKLKDCFDYLFSRRNTLCHYSIGLTSKDINKIMKHFKKYLKL